MQQSFRRQLFALGRLGGSADLTDLQHQEFIQSVLAVDINLRPHTEAVLDVLLTCGVSPASAARFVESFDAAVWRQTAANR